MKWQEALQEAETRADELILFAKNFEGGDVKSVPLLRFESEIDFELCLGDYERYSYKDYQIMNKALQRVLRARKIKGRQFHMSSKSFTRWLEIRNETASEALALVFAMETK